jgi:ABC-2 type transport system permease protein
MSVGRVIAIARQDLRILRTDLMPVMVLVVMPLLLMPFLLPAFGEALRVGGLTTANGAEQAVPGMAVTFGFFLVANVCFGFYREHTWHTWERLRASPAGSAEILLGKMVAPLLQAAVQFVVLFGLGGYLMHLHVRGSWPALVAVGGSFSLYLVTTGLAVTALCRTFLQANAIVNITALVLAGFAGAIVPSSLLPPWAQDIAPAIPSYWAMQGYQRAILGEGGGVLVPVSILLAFSAALALVALAKFRFDETKVGFP